MSGDVIVTTVTRRTWTATTKAGRVAANWRVTRSSWTGGPGLRVSPRLRECTDHSRPRFTDHHDTPYSRATSAPERVEPDTARSNRDGDLDPQA